MELKTFRLYIRNLREDDWTRMKSLFIDFNNSKYAIYDRPLPTEDMEIEALTKQFVENSLFFAIYLLDKNQMIGYVCFHKDVMLITKYLDLSVVESLKIDHLYHSTRPPFIQQL